MVCPLAGAVAPEPAHLFLKAATAFAIGPQFSGIPPGPVRFEAALTLSRKDQYELMALSTPYR